jgi:PAS domain S-box-containing protein/putative nucleotidyltransferase with HDIG domain
MKDDDKTKKQLIHELAELRSQNAALKKSESPEKYRSLVEDLRDVIYELDSQGVVLYISPAIRDLLGYDSAEIVGKNFNELAHKDDLSSQAKWFSELRKGVESPSEYRVIDKSGEYKWAQTRVRPIIEDGQFKGAHGILIDVTEQKRAENTLRESEEKYRHVFENSIMGISQTLHDGRLITVNNAYAKMYGYTNAEEMMTDVSSVGPLYANPQEREDVLRILTDKGVMEPREITVIRRDGTRFTVLVGTREIRDFKGNLLYYQAEQIDITERKRVEDALRESEESFRTYLEFAPDGVYISDMKGTFLYGNRKCEVIIGYRREELIGKNFLELNILPEKSLNNADQLLQANIEGKSTGPDEIELINKEGRIIPVEISTSVVQQMGQRIVLSFVRDITDRKRTEEALQESENKYRWVLDNMADVITVMDMNLCFTYVSPSIMHMRGYTAEEAVAQTFEQVMTPESLQISAKVFEEEMKLEASGTADPDRIRIVEVEQYRKDGSIVLMENHLSFMRDEAKKPVGIISVSHDITARKRAEEELQRTLESLRKSFAATIQVMVAAVESRDPYTAGHQISSADLARAIATEMGLPPEKIDGIRTAGAIHDIGKLSIPAEILSKPTKLSEIEFSLIKEHARKGYEILKDVESPWPLAEIVHQHHERMDGSGYPNNLKGDEILMEARILAVADVVEAMASHRPYRPGLGIKAALDEIEKNRGAIYDKTVADACLRLFREKGFILEGA